MEPAHLEAMARSLGSGPRTTSIGVHGCAGVVRALRPVTPEDDLDRQPLRGASGTTLLVADVRLDDRAGLARALGVERATAERLSDADLVLLAHERWGETFFERLLGAFAIACWDARAGRLLCARDPMGERPLHYASGPHWFAFASTARALVDTGLLPRALDDVKLVDALARLPVDHETTYYRSVRRLPPGYALEATARGVRTRRYFEPARAARLTLASDDEYVVAASALLEEAVRARLRSRRPLAVLMSGGLDSPAVASVAARQKAAAGESLVTFTAVPRDGSVESLPGRFGDERPFVEAFRAMHPNVEVCYVEAPVGRLFEDLDPHHEHAEAPVLSPFNFLWVTAIARLAKERGIGVLLSGQLGNITLSWHGRARPTPSLLARLTAAARGWLLRRAGRDVRDWEQTPLRREAVRRYGLNRRVWRSEWLRPRPPSGDGRLERLHAWRRGAANTGLGTLPAHGLETRDPMGDRRIFELCLALPPDQFARGGRTRLLIRRMMKDRLPALQLDNPRRGWQSSDWLAHLSDARPRLSELLERIGSSPLCRELIDLPRMRGLLESWPPPDAAGSAAALASHHGVLPRAIAVGLFVEWFERRAAS